jgi:gliding motility-associated-like protein
LQKIKVLKRNITFFIYYLTLILFFFPSFSSAQLTCTATITPATCSANGSATAIAQGGSGSYNYQLSAPASCLAQSILQSNPTFNALKPCTYTLTINDLVTGAQCQTTVTVTGNYTLPNLNLTTTHCKITANVVGGNDPFTFSYSTSSNNGPFTTNNPPSKNTFTGLPNGNVWIQVQDSCGNTFTQQTVLGNNPITGFNMPFTNGTLSVNTIVGGNAPYTYKLVNNSGTVTNNTGIFTNVTVDCNAKVTVSDSCTNKTITYNVPVDGTIDCVNFKNGTATLTPTSGIPPYTFLHLVNNVVVTSSSSPQLTGLPLGLLKYDFRIVDACGKVKNLSIEALNPQFTGSTNCGTPTNLVLQIRRNNGSTNNLFYPITVAAATAIPANTTLASPNNKVTFTATNGNPTIFVIEDACGDKVTCKDSLILVLNTNCVNITASLLKVFICDNNTSNDFVPLSGTVTYTLTDAQGNVIATNTNGNFTSAGPGTYTITASHPNCGTITKTLTVNPGSQQINPTINTMLRYRVVNGKCVPRYDLAIPTAEGPFVLSGNNTNQNLTTITNGFYTVANLAPGTYTLTSTTFCTSVTIFLPTPSYNMTAQVVQSCPGDAQVLLTGAKDFNYWKNWVQTQSPNLNLLVWNNNNGPHKDFYTTVLNNNFTNFVGEPYTIKNLNPGQNYNFYLYPYDAKESGGGCPVDTVQVDIPAYNQLKAAASRGIICDGQSATDIKVWINPISITNPKASGKKPYTYQKVSCANLTTPIGSPINTPDTSVVFSNIPQGTHCFKVIDACGVSADYQTEAGPLGAGQYIGVNCGLLRLQVDTIPTATYQWTNTTIGQSLSNQYFTLVPTPAAQTNFTCAINIAGCQMTRNITIPAGVGLVTVAITPSAATTFCQGQNINLTATGNANTYQWNNGQSGSNITVSSSGTYKVTATNLLGCIDTAKININVVPPANGSLIAQNISCFGQNNGQITLQNLSNNNVTYLWSNGATTQNINNLSANTYFLTVTDQNNCKTTFNTAISQPPVLQTSINSVDITCKNANDGIANVNISGGTAPYNITWSNNQKTTQVNNLAAGNYTVNVIDLNGCNNNNNLTINEPDALTLSINPQNPTVCVGEKVNISAIAQGGNGGFTFLWSNGNTQPAQTLGKGSYSITVTDNKGCKAYYSFDVVETTTVSVPLLNNAVLCEGTSKKLEVGGNFKAFAWSTGATTASININEAKQYCVTVTTQGDCVGDTCINITQAPNPQPIIIGDTLICKENKTTLKVSKNFSQYTWSNNILTSQNVVGVGIFQVTVTDNNGCKGSNNYEVSPRQSPNVSIFTDKKLCFGDSILLKAKANALSFDWNNGKKSDAIFASQKGNYCVTITDKFGCKNDTCLIVEQFDLPQPVIAGDSLFCKNEAATLFCPLSFEKYEWSNNEKNDSIKTNLSGIYTLKVTDKNGCIGEKKYPIKDLPLPSFSFIGDTSFCSGKKITLELDKIFPAYNWSNQGNTSSILIEKGGKYSITVTDTAGCKNTNEIFIKENVLPSPTIVGVTAICAQSSTTISVGEVFEKYLWSNNAKSKSINVFKADNYSVTVTDKNGCENSISQAILPIDKLTPAIVGDFIFCKNEVKNLTLNQNFAQYNWSNGEKNASLKVVQSGNYCVTVTDINGCKGDTCAKIVVNPLPTANILGKKIVCGDATTTLTASPFSLQYKWSNGEEKNIIDVKSGSYQLTFTDSNGCSDTLSTVVVAAPDVKIKAEAILQSDNFAISCANKGDGKAIVNIMAGSPPYTYAWSNGAKSAAVQNLKAGNYQLTVTDKYGCLAIDTILLTQPLPLSMLATVDPVKCFGDKNGRLTIEKINGGNDFFEYKLNNQGFTPVKNLPILFDNLPSNQYKLVVKDKNNCTAEQTLLVDTPPLYALSIPAIDTVITGDSVQLQPMLNFAPDSIFWSPSVLLSCSDCLHPWLKPKQYFTTISLWAWKNGCPAQGNLTVFSRNFRNHRVFIPTVFSPNGDDTNDIFTVYNNPTVALIEKLEIYDRWGELLWEGYDFEPEKIGWDGNFRGKPMNAGVFVFVARVRFKDGVKEKIIGDFTLVR